MEGEGQLSALLVPPLMPGHGDLARGALHLAGSLCNPEPIFLSRAHAADPGRLSA